MATVKFSEQQKEWAVKAGAGIVMFVLCYAVMVHPVFQQIATLRQGIVNAQKRSELYRAVQDLKTTLTSRESPLATLAERSQLLGKISDIAGRTQLEIETLTPHTDPEGGYVKMKVTVNGQGAFFSLLKFLKIVEKEGAAIKVRDLTLLRNLSPNPQDGKSSLQIQLEFETFLKQRGKNDNV